MSKPKLMTLHAPTVRNQRTLIWLQHHATDVPWSKWDSIVTSVDDYYKWFPYSTITGLILTSIAPIASIDTFIDDIYSISKKVSVIFITQSILSLKSEEFWKDNFDNLIQLDTILDTYPNLLYPWDGTNEDAIAIFALLCRYNRVVDCTISSKRLSISNSMLSIESNITPNKVWLITQFYQSSDVRSKEIAECLRKNCECPYIDTIVLINEKDYSKELKEYSHVHFNKIKQVIHGKRLTYADFLYYVCHSVPSDVFVILSNSDIYFGDSLIDLWKINLQDKMMALLRWDQPEQGLSTIFGPRADSQDSWICLSNSIKSRSWDFSKFRFQLGQPGCDNAFAGHMLRNRFVLINPALTFKTYHLHNSNIRTYHKNNVIQSDLYINLVPTYIIDTKQEQTPGTYQAISNEAVSFEIKSSSISNEITYCTMLEEEGRYKWEASVENYYFEPAIAVYSWKNSCVTPNGLVYDLYRIYTGKNIEEYNYWKTTNINIFTTLQKCKKMFAIPFANTDIFQNPDTYILQYLTRCLRLLSDYPDTSFWVPSAYEPHLKQFTSLPNTLTFDENTACWAEEVFGFLPSSLEFGREDMNVLRNALPSWLDKPSSLICTIVIDHTITHEFAKDIAYFFLKKDEWTIKFADTNEYASYEPFLGSSLCIFVGGKKSEKVWSRLWSLPKGCCVIEFQQELKIDGEFQHLAHVCDFTSWVLLLSKGNVEKQILQQIEKWYSKNEGELKVGPDF